MGISFFGIRHHGPGSAANVRDSLNALRPDVILLEGPVEATPLLEWVMHEDMQPPVAILAYVPGDLNKALFFPFAEFSPEWQAILYARKNNIPLRFMDLPIAHKLALKNEEQPQAQNQETTLNNTGYDPFSKLANIAGFQDAEKWWEHQFENRIDSLGVFDAIDEAVSALRMDRLIPDEWEEKCREAWMRKTIRETQKEMFAEIAVICGAWHVPALKAEIKAKDDNEVLKGLPKVKVDCTWVPWSYRRLSFESGYGAGINSPGWYHHLWHHHDPDGIRWLSSVAAIFRKQNIDISSAHIIEAVRLSNTLASMRGLSMPGLEEHNEAIVSTMCMGDEILMSVIRDELIVSPRLGSVPKDSPKPPLQLDIDAHLKKLRIPLSESPKELNLDLREERDLEKSIFIHRLKLLGINWGYTHYVGTRGTFKEAWTLQWDPQFSIDIVDKGIWGNTLLEACTNYTIDMAQHESSISKIAESLNEVLLSDLLTAGHGLMKRIEDLSANNSDVIQLMNTVPMLVNALKYGNVRNTDKTFLKKITDAIISRVCICIPASAISIDEDSSQNLVESMFGFNTSLNLLTENEYENDWINALMSLSNGDATAPVVSGYACRLLYDLRELQSDQVGKYLSRALSISRDYNHAALWLEGFLRGSGTVLLVDRELWEIVNGWMAEIEEQHFVYVLPLLRRTFSRYETPERRKLGEMAKNGSKALHVKMDNKVDQIAGDASMEILLKLFKME
ncbi:MAG TPA: DUF5682 family protein [Bacteroidia bacterium]